MEKLRDIISKGEYKRPRPERNFQAKIEPGEFAEHFILNATAKLGYSGDAFIVDDTNKDVINQLYYFLIGSDKFTGHLDRGVLLLGALGSGKTLIMESFVDVFNNCSGKIITKISSRNISSLIDMYMDRKPLFVDDIGKEQTTVTNYGTVSRPFEDLINDRYKNNALTFGTSNLKLEDMPYNMHTIDRMKQMFNVLILPGKSRR